VDPVEGPDHLRPPHRSPFLGSPLRAFVLTRVRQRLLTEVSAALTEVPEVVEVHGLSGGADLLIQVVAKDADDLLVGRNLYQPVGCINQL
jgi:DNA-binding Lrp family transcriptional regulator